MSVLGNGDEPHNSRHACAACKHQRKKCEHDCIFAPHYPQVRANYFREVHKIFGVKNITNILEYLSPEERKKAVDSLEWEALAWKEDPANGPLGALKEKEKEIELLKNQLIHNFNQQIVVPYQTKSSGSNIGFNHNSTTGIVANSSNVNATNFGNYVVDTSQSLILDGTMNNYGGLPHNYIGGVPYYSIPQGQGRSMQDVVSIVPPTANILQKQEAQRNHQTLDPVEMMSRPAANSFHQGNLHRRGNQARFHASFSQGSFSGSQVKGKNTLP